MAWFFLPRNYCSLLDHDLMASICKKAISISAGNLNSGLKTSAWNLTTKPPIPNLQIFLVNIYTVKKNLEIFESKFNPTVT